MESKKLSQEELSSLQELNKSFTQSKISIGDLEIQKEGLISKVKLIKAQFVKLEQELIKKYGDQSVINLQTGEVTEKKE
ncbi:MAG: hypothetical protein GOVbin3205_71 [Prokaryotic dsDNA virus sp.]|jgi:hypothetical protein|nr:MAG: hypothetical protein GOVbin3205_71 [Prokaryotic dsDNA virus sp.]|tara:strand:- start:510 stop:746 length:237 start_codon:yes stop_codon:yes gene_type:complete